MIRLSEPHPAVLLAMSTSLTPIMPKHIFGDGSDLKIHARNAAPVGSGPFKLVEFKPGEHIVMERFDRFLQKDQPRLDRIIAKLYKDPSSLLLAFERGEVDVHQGLADPRAVERAGSWVRSARSRKRPSRPEGMALLPDGHMRKPPLPR